MPRQVLEVANLVDLEQVVFTAPVRLVFASPWRRGGPALSVIRAALAPRGRLRLSGTPVALFADLDPGAPEELTLALDTIARSDAEGLERMLLSVLPYVDEIVLGVDGRSDQDTLRVAQAYADCVYVFEAAEIGVSAEDWEPSDKNPRGKINFAAARNLGRERVKSPWVIVLDSDEYLKTKVDLRELVSNARHMQGAFAPLVVIEPTPGRNVFESRDYQRIARTRYRWVSATHNQLLCDGCEVPPEVDVQIISDTSLRTITEQMKRDAQRDIAVDDLMEGAAQGDLNALFHIAKHRAGAGDLAEAVRLAEDFRLRVEPNSVLAFQRQWVALAIAWRFYNEGDFMETNRWCCRALLDGPAIAAFCILGDAAESEGDLLRARNWYEAACAVEDMRGIAWPGLTEMRWGRLAGIRQAMVDPESAGTIDVIDAEPDSARSASETGQTSGT